MNLPATMKRKEQIARADPARFGLVRQKIEDLTRRNADAATVELMMESVQRLTLLAYEIQDGDYCNIDAVTHRLLIPAPWGRQGHKRWGIAYAESTILRFIVQRRQSAYPPGLWQYDRSRRAWLLNLYDYDTLIDAQRYWRLNPITVKEYRQVRRNWLEGRVSPT